MHEFLKKIQTGQSGGRIAVEARFSAFVQTGPANILCGGYRLSFPGVKLPGRGVDLSPPSSAEVEGKVELYLSFVSGPS